MKNLLKQKNFFIASLLGSLLIKVLIFGASLPEALVFISLTASYSYLYFLNNKEIPDYNIAIKNDVDFLKSELGRLSIQKATNRLNNAGNKF